MDGRLFYLVDQLIIIILKTKKQRECKKGTSQGPLFFGKYKYEKEKALDDAKHLKVWDGGLPLNPAPPWNYSLFFNINGLTNEYDGEAYFLKDFKSDFGKENG